MYVLRTKKSISGYHYFKTLMAMGIPELTSNISYAPKFKSYDKAQNMANRCALHFDIVEV